jgi:hypothetical protein
MSAMNLPVQLPFKPADAGGGGCAEGELTVNVIELAPSW